MLKRLFYISVEYEFKTVKFKGVSIDLKMNNLDLRGNTTEFKTLPTRPRSHRYTECIKKTEQIRNRSQRREAAQTIKFYD